MEEPIQDVLVGCASSQAVDLEGPNGETAQCGPSYWHPGFLIERIQETEEQLLRKCIADYERRGFRQVPALPKTQTGDMK